MVEDKQLIAQYAAERAEAPFAELVRRHLNLVYATALRHVNGDKDLAEDIAQTVFSDLARKANQLTRNTSVAGWLYTSARFAAANAVRSEARRRVREETANAMIDRDTNSDEASIELRFLVDDALDQLSQTDREAILLRYFESFDFAAVGEALGTTQNAARMRVERSLEKLRAILEKRGLTTTSAALAATFSEWAAKATPAELPRILVASAMSQAANSGTAMSPLAKLWTAINSKVVGAAAMFAVFAGAIYVVQDAARHKLGSAPLAPRSLNNSTTAGGAGTTPALVRPTGDAHALQKLLERHDARVRAEREHRAEVARTNWDKATKEFDDWIKASDGTGVQRFGAKIRVALGSGQTLVTGGWSPEPGKRIVAFVTLVQIDAAGNRAPPGTSSGQISLESRVVSGKPEVFDKLGLQTVTAPGRESTVEKTMTSAEAETLASALEKADDTDLLAAPRVTTLDHSPAEVSVVQNEMIAGQEQEVGLRVGTVPLQSWPDGSVDLGVVMRLTEPIEANQNQRGAESS